VLISKILKYSSYEYCCYCKISTMRLKGEKIFIVWHEDPIAKSVGIAHVRSSHVISWAPIWPLGVMGRHWREFIISCLHERGPKSFKFARFPRLVYSATPKCMTTFTFVTFRIYLSRELIWQPNANVKLITLCY
jgi:hypothetical protein